MEDINYRTDFENFLKDSIEDFKMLPARKIWHSIYNNMHPDRKWPSITVCLLILISILYLGISNNNTLNKAALTVKEQNNYLLAKNNINVAEKDNNSERINNEKRKQQSNNSVVTSQTINISTNKAEQIKDPTNKFNNNSTKEINSLNDKSSANSNQYVNVKHTDNFGKIASNNKHVTMQKTNKNANTNSSTIISASLTNQNDLANNNVTKVENIDKLVSTDKNSNLNIIEKSISNASTGSILEVTNTKINKNENVQLNKRENVSESKEVNPSISTDNIIQPSMVSIVADITPKKEININKENVIVTEIKKPVLTSDNLNSNNKTSKQSVLIKLKENSSISYYLTPSLGYRIINKVHENKNYGTTTSSFAPTSTIINLDGQPKDEKALNLEAGVSLNYKLSKSIHLKTGLQVNYTNYVSKVNDLGHPIQTTLAVSNTQQNNYRPSQYTTSEGKTHLNKSTLQMSIPIGMDYKIVGNSKIKWFIGSTFQPTFIISGNAYVMSMDGKNYINEKPLLRKINFNTALETYLSIKTSNSIILNVGPQVRYQLLSTFKNDYNYSEKLYNLGIKIGVTTSF